MTGHLLVELVENDYRIDPVSNLKNPSGIGRVTELMEQACDELNRRYLAVHPDETFRLHPFELSMECKGPCWANNGRLRSDLNGSYHDIRGQSVYFCHHRNCGARMKGNQT